MLRNIAWSQQSNMVALHPKDLTSTESVLQRLRQQQPQQQQQQQQQQTFIDVYAIEVCAL
jgi:hypothetical protein